MRNLTFYELIALLIDLVAVIIAAITLAVTLLAAQPAAEPMPVVAPTTALPGATGEKMEDSKRSLRGDGAKNRTGKSVKPAF